MRPLSFPLLAALLLLALPACGGGSSSTGAPAIEAPQAMVLGAVVTRDGATTELDGIEVQDEAGETVATTDANGRFETPVRAGRRFRLRFHDPRARGGVVDDDLEERKDESEDGTDIDGDEIEIAELDEDEVCEVEVELDDGEVVGSWVEREKEGEDGERRREHDGETPLCPPEGKTEDGPRGEIEFGGDEDCVRMEIEAEGLGAYDLLEAVLEHADGTEEVLGILEVDEEGDVHFVFEACGIDDLPFGVENAKALAGAKLWIVDDLGTVILKGRLPERRREHEGDDSDDEKEDGDDEKDEEAKPRVEDFALTSPLEDSDAKGGGVVKCYPECCVLVVEVGFLDGPADYDIVLVDAEENETLLDEFEVGEEGSARYAEEFCDEIPFEAESLAELAGTTILIVDAEGTTILAGTLPTFPAEDTDTPPAE